jgi:MGT family glycosyltransferase
VPAEGDAFLRFHEPPAPAAQHGLPDWVDRDAPLVYVTFGSVTGGLPPFAGVFRAALDALAGLDARVLMTVGRAVDPEGLGPLPSNARVAQWLPQDAVLAQAAAMLGHGGFGTTMGALIAGVPQAVVPLFASDQLINGEHVAAVGAGVVVSHGPEHVAAAGAEIPRLLADPAYPAAARRIAAAFAELPRPAEAVPVLAGLGG